MTSTASTAAPSPTPDASAAPGRPVTIVIPLYNQLHFTKICLDSLVGDIAGGVRVIAIDNGSSDGTGEYLGTRSDVEVICNAENLGCAGAWNQGVRTSRAEWTIILNNDTIVAPGWIAGLLSFAEERALDVVSPAIREGEYNYDIADYGTRYTSVMGGVARLGEAHGVCFMVHRRVFDAIGGFDENFRIGQFEDSDFFRRARIAGFRLGTTGRSFMHHYGSVTQDSIRKRKGCRPYEAENRAYFRKKWKLCWWRRKAERMVSTVRCIAWRTSERVRFGHSLKEKWVSGRLRYF